MKKLIILVFAFISINAVSAQADGTNDYVEFDDRKNVVHGVYIGLGAHYGKMDGEDTGLVTLKLAYVANHQLEVGLVATTFYNDRPNTQPDLFDGDKVVLVGSYGGFHVEPILFGRRFISVSFPTLIGGGIVAYSGIDTIEDNNGDIKKKDFDGFFAVEPGINILYNFSRFIQLETGIRYRFTSDYDLSPFKEKGNLNGYSIMVGLKVGIFNMGRKKKIKDKF